MKHTPVLILSIIAVSLLPALAEESVDAKIEELRKTGKLHEAYNQLSKSIRENPDNEEVNMYFGHVCVALDDLERAQLAFERVILIDPDNHRARLELAEIYMKTEQYNLARKGFESVLEADPPPVVRKNIESYLARLEKAEDRFSLSGRIDAGYFYDDNVNVGPDSKIIYTAPIIFSSGATITSLSIDEDSQPTEDDGIVVSGSLYATYDCGRERGWLLATDLSYYQNQLNDHAEHETQYYQVRAGLKHASARTLLELPVSTAHITRGDDDLIDIHGVSPRLLYLSKNVEGAQWITHGNVSIRDYDTLNDRDGTYYALGETFRKYLGKARHSISLGISLFRDDTDADVYTYTGRSTTFGWKTRLPWDSTFYATFRYASSDYKAREILAPEDRADRQHLITAGLNKMFTSWWGVNVQLQRTDNTSTFNLYEFDRNLITATTYCVF